MRALEERMDHKIEDLAHEIYSTKQREENSENQETHTSSSREYIEFLLKENASLKGQNAGLIERANNLSYIMSDLNSKVEDLENDKKSLTTAIKILQEGQDNINHHHRHEPWKVTKKGKHGQS